MKRLKEILENLKITLSEKKIILIEDYIEEIINKNEIVGLISKNDIQLIYERHIADSLIPLLSEEISKLFNNVNALDIGSGGGFPSVVLAIAFEKTCFYAAESNRKKYEFLLWIKHKLKLENFHPLNERITISHSCRYHIITQRATGKFETVLKIALPLLLPEGYFISWLSSQDAEKNKKIFNFIYNYSLEGRNMALCVIKKNKNSSS
ncbi:MAG: 16S rRNA (guanine(527)-N(7))-methyltransferase RsmG [Elusimicrobiales bacterium]